MKALILAGGKNKRMGRNKALIKLNGETIIENQIRLLRGIFEETLIITNSPWEYQHLKVRMIEDVIPQKGPLGGIYSGLFYSESFYNFFLACDIPFPNVNLIAYMKNCVGNEDVIIPRGTGFEPLFAFYSKDCLLPMKKQIDSESLRITDFLSRVKVRVLETQELNKFDPAGVSFFNINTREDLKKARNMACLNASTRMNI